jgi:hypothetical protein
MKYIVDDYVSKQILMDARATVSGRKEVIIYGKKYQIIKDGEELSIKRFDKKVKMWITLCFAPEGTDTTQIIKDIRTTAWLIYKNGIDRERGS